ncbi:hypothetical protein DFS34DRAFT_380799 [Phlyctochytrium arcticum]|nr:hypothetical protein DFS34DRAFT_380799 [Phlyctochytrium arcticum]
MATGSKKRDDIRPSLPPAGHPASSRGSIAGSIVGRQRISPRSQVLQYELYLKELFTLHPRSPSAHRTTGIFSLFAELIPLLGSLSAVMRTIRDDLYDAVYSMDFTSSEEVGGGIERVPWFAAVRRMSDARTEDGAKTSEAVSDLHQKLKFREYDLQILHKKNLALKQELTDHDAERAQLRVEIDRLNEVIRSQEREKTSLKGVHSKAEEGLRREIDTLNNSLAQSNHIIEKLTIFKSSYDENTHDETVEDPLASGAKQALVIDSQGMVEYDMYQAERLEEQFADILNWQLDDYESALAQLRKKKEILSGVTTNEEEREMSYKIELSEIVGGFRKRVADLLEEQQLLRKHIQGLKVVLANYAGDKLMATVRRTADEALRRYAFTMTVSDDDGITFQPWKNIQPCAKCGERTVVCPHKILHTETLTIPYGSTHLRFQHPSLRLRTNFDRTLFESTLAGKLLSSSVSYSNEDVVGPTEDENMELSKTFKAIWQEFYENREGVKPRSNRQYTLQKVIGFIHEIYDARWAYEEAIEKDIGTDTPLTRFVDFFYELMIDRYQIKDIARKAIHDVFTALYQYEEFNAAVTIFTRHLSCEEDVMWKYLCLIKKLLSAGEVSDASGYRKLMAIIYPSRTKEIYDQMELEFVAFSKNRFSREMVEEHVMHMLRTSIEPNQRFFTRTLKRYDYQEQGHLNYEDFDEALSQILPGAPTKMKRVRYALAELDTGAATVPLERLGLIGAYISLYCCYLSGWTPQALIVGGEAFKGDNGGAAGKGLGGPGRSREMSQMDEQAEQAGEMQEEIESLLRRGGGDAPAVDEQTVEEEAMRMAKRVAILQRMGNLSDDDDDDNGSDAGGNNNNNEDDDRVSELPRRR